MRRAIHLAKQEMEARPGELPISLMQLSHYLLFRAGATAGEIAALMEYERRHVAKRLMGCMAALGTLNAARRARVETLVSEMGQICLEPRRAEIVPFGGPSRLSQRYAVEAL